MDEVINFSKRVENNYIDHDSFEPSIKVGDEWWFEGDIVESVWCYGAIVFDGFAFLIDCDTQYSARLLNAQSNMKRIGNIHDNKTEGDNEKI